MTLVVSIPGHGLDELRRYETVLNPPYRPGNLVRYRCTVCGFDTEWISVKNDELAARTVMRHWQDQVADQINAIEGTR